MNDMNFKPFFIYVLMVLVLKLAPNADGFTPDEAIAIAGLANIWPQLGWGDTSSFNCTGSVQLSGVTCNGGHVIGLYDSSSSLLASIPNANFRGSTSLATHLQIEESLNGSLAFAATYITKLQNLQTLELLSADRAGTLSGTIPESLLSMPSVLILNLSGNQLAGPIPDVVASAARIDFSFNRLTGTVPGELVSSPMLIYLDLSWNLLYGSLPTFENATQLQWIKISNNLLNGTIPLDITVVLEQLDIFDVSFNSLTGTIPTGMFDSNGSHRLGIFLQGNALLLCSGNHQYPNGTALSDCNLLPQYSTSDICSCSSNYPVQCQVGFPTNCKSCIPLDSYKTPTLTWACSSFTGEYYYPGSIVVTAALPFIFPPSSVGNSVAIIGQLYSEPQATLEVQGVGGLIYSSSIFNIDESIIDLQLSTSVDGKTPTTYPAITFASGFLSANNVVIQVAGDPCYRAMGTETRTTLQYVISVVTNPICLKPNSSWWIPGVIVGSIVLLITAVAVSYLYFTKKFPCQKHHSAEESPLIK